VRDLTFRTVGLGDDAVDYQAAWDLQRELHASVVAGGAEEVLLLEHPPVFTAGRRTEPHERPGLEVDVPVVDVDRGGTGRDSSSATRSCGCPTTSTSSTTCAASRRR